MAAKHNNNLFGSSKVVQSTYATRGTIGLVGLVVN